MSPPDTDLEKQKRRHIGPLLGMRAVVAFALVLLALLAVYVFARGDDPGDDGAGIDGTAPAAAVEQD